MSQTLDEVSLAEEIGTFENGILTPIGHGGRRLTSSQAARLTLARGLLAKPRLLIVDGTLDTLPLHTAQQVLKNVMKYEASTSIVLLTSRADIAAELPTVHLQRSAKHGEAR